MTTPADAPAKKYPKTLRERFVKLHEGEHGLWIWIVLTALYSDRRRFYHTMQHIEACLALLDEVQEAFSLTPEEKQGVELALWWHDAVYVPGADDNEEMSADLLYAVRRKLKVEPDVLAFARQAILATKHQWVLSKGAPTDVDTRDVLLRAVVTDIDLSILGQPRDTYKKYAEQVRKEFAHVTDTDWRRGRAKVLRNFLGRARIYETGPMLSRFEERARENLRWEIGTLE